MPAVRTLALLSLAAFLIGGCAASPSPQDGRLVVFAASSLRTAFTELAESFRSANPDATVELFFAGSADLLAQLTGGAQADVYASADTPSMDKAARAGVVSDSVAFTTNTLTIAVAPGNPLGIKSFRDLTGVSVVACAPQVPCGAALARIESATGVDLFPVSEENAVADVLGKVVTGQADAGLVYATDARAAAGAITAVPFPEAADAVNTYRIAVTRQAADPAAARRFVDTVTGPTGRAVLARAGFR